MKIILGSNIFGESHRQSVAIDSWLHLKDKHDLDVYNVQFIQPEYTDNRINTLNVLDRDSTSVTGGSKKLPFVNDIFNSLAHLDCDYFIYCNSDVIVNANLLKFINSNQPDCFACSRLDINNIKSFDDVLNKQIQPIRYEIAGFDTFIFSRHWYKKHNSLFRDYLIGQPCWDQVYATIMKIYGDNTDFGNSFPPYCFHIHHEQTWQQSDTPEKTFNMNQKEHYFDKLMCRLFDMYLKGVLIKREPYGAFMRPVTDEKQLEHNFFKNITCQNPKFV